MLADELRRMLEQFVDKRVVQAFLIEGKVTEIDKDNKTCDFQPLTGKAPYQDVRLLPLSGNNSSGIVIYPKKDTNAVILRKDDTEAFLFSCQEVESTEWFVGEEFKLEVKNDGTWNFNDGKNGGLIKIKELQTQIDKNSQILQKLMSALSSPVNEPGNGLPSVLQQTLNGVLKGSQTADLSNITNDKINH